VESAGDATKAALLEALDAQRAHILGALDGLDPVDLHRPVLPSGWTVLGLVHHLALDVERFWFRRTMAAEWITDDPVPAWEVGPEVPPDEVTALYREETGRSDAIIAATPLEAPPEHWPEQFGSWRLPDLRAVLLHVITETACHAGHLDAARELIDGRTWLIIGAGAE